MSLEVTGLNFPEKIRNSLKFLKSIKNQERLPTVKMWYKIDKKIF